MSTESTLTPASGPVAETRTRTGKIARLPRPLRDEVNRRLDNGEPAPGILAWLNREPAVKKALATWFDDRPVTAQNLSEWRQGGFQDWLQLRENAAWARIVLDEADSFAEIATAEAADNDAESAPHGLPLSDRFAAHAALALAKIIRTAAAGSLESAAAQKALLQAVRTLNWLRQSDHQAVRLKMDLLRWEEEKALIRRESDDRVRHARTFTPKTPPFESRVARPPSPSPAPAPAPAPADDDSCAECAPTCGLLCECNCHHDDDPAAGQSSDSSPDANTPSAPLDPPPPPWNAPPPGKKLAPPRSSSLSKFPANPNQIQVNPTESKYIKPKPPY